MDEAIKISKKDMRDYTKFSGLGSCGPVSVILRDKNKGQIEIGMFGPEGDYLKSFTHYWIRTRQGKIIDLCNPDKNKKGWTYWDITKLKKNEWPDAIWSKDDVEWWRGKIKGI